jgi:predicted TIM-barrel fold metal-dependent hydrolase
MQIRLQKLLIHSYLTTPRLLVSVPEYSSSIMSFYKVTILPFLAALVDHLLEPLLRHARPYLQPPQWLSTHHNAASQKRSITSKTPDFPRNMAANAWDCHMHVTSPKYPLAADAAYKPSSHLLKQAMQFERTIGICNIVLVQPSIYGNDNSCLLDALKSIGSQHGRGVVGIDPDTISLAKLKEWHELGVRGVRLNLKSNNTRFTEESLKATLQSYANVIKPFDWVLELFIGMEDIPMLERVSKDLGVRLCIAHFGVPKLPALEKRALRLDPYDLEGFQSLVNMLRAGNTWLKVSGAYRFDEDPNMRGVESIARELLKVAGDRLVFASDWPHTRFDGLDVKPFVERCLEWTNEAGLTKEVFTLNAQDLWDVPE